jgi:dipicolinate synthase subunit A
MNYNMVGSLKGLKVTIVGGDKREVELFKYFVKAGALVTVIGFEKLALYFPRKSLSTIKEGIQDADILIFSLTGIDDNGKVYAPYAEKEIILDMENLFLIKKGALILSGYIPEHFKKELNELGIYFQETAPLNEISIQNAVPTAEGAILRAMEMTDITIHGSNVFVLGFGRCGLILSDKLRGLSAKVTVVARRDEILSYACALGYRTLKLESIHEKINEADIIFNTIPALVLTAELLCLLSKNTVIIDIASYPGGVDFAAAFRLGLKAELMPGIPGRIAPKSAGKILASIYPALIIKILKGKEL